jgi:hypothetical protein
VLVVALVAQALLFAGLILVAVNGFPFLGGGREAAPGTHPERGLLAPSTAPTPTVNRFDAEHAYVEAHHEVSLGPRPAGSRALRRLARHLRARLPAGRYEDLGPAHPRLRNVVGTIPGLLPALVFAAHYDTKDIPNFVGAEDGASGSAVLLELSRTLRRARRPAGARQVRFVFFDGEESPRGSPPRRFYVDGLRGSKAYLAAHPGEVWQLVLLGFVGQRNLSLPREASSNPYLWAQLRDAAQHVGVARVFPNSTAAPILDDHTPFLRAGIPAIDLIDFDYPYWHTKRDTFDKLSGRSMDAVGETVAELALRLRRP